MGNETVSRTTKNLSGEKKKKKVSSQGQESRLMGSREERGKRKLIVRYEGLFFCSWE